VAFQNSFAGLHTRAPDFSLIPTFLVIEDARRSVGTNPGSDNLTFKE
jgi:hypothetical protein